LLQAYLILLKKKKPSTLTKSPRESWIEGAVKAPDIRAEGLIYYNSKLLASNQNSDVVPLRSLWAGKPRL